MITTISNHLIDWLIREDTLQPADRELYVYLCILFSICMDTAISFIYYQCMYRKTAKALLLILPFMTIRKFSGGFHAKTARVCLIISCTLLSGFMYLAIHISTCLALYIVLALASISLMINSPIVSPQRPATLDEQKHFRNVVIAAMILYNSIILLLSCTGFSHWAVCLALGLILSAALQIPCIISKMKTS